MYPFHHKTYLKTFIIVFICFISNFLNLLNFLTQEGPVIRVKHDDEIKDFFDSAFNLKDSVPKLYEIIL